MATEFNYIGKLPASKSLFNRALVVQSYFPSLQILGQTQAQDVTLMRQGLRSLFSKLPIDCGHAGTVLRFLAVRASKETGEFVFRGSERLMYRRSEDLLKLLRQLGSEAEYSGNELRLKSEGWHLRGDCLQIPSTHSSQFASAVLINSWGLKSPLHFTLSSNMASKGYWQMTVKQMEYMGLALTNSDNEYTVGSGQKPTLKHYVVEPDMSSAFSVCAAASVAGQCSITPFPNLSLQPDFSFVEILQNMGAKVEVKESCLSVGKSTPLQAVDVDLKQAPDLFPVLAVLCALAEGKSRLYGAPHLKDKESDRLAETAKLLTALGVKHEPLNDGVIIHGPVAVHDQPIAFNSANDHRMAMAAAVARKAGFNISIDEPGVVDKSFPEFWQVIGEPQ